ncbi:hypothetical protein [Paraburkholderia sp. UYCP14C]|jgi:hypothetical protein|uniref:hypothetical protein n=1 Tax=Paraburkholderia sp. UYCP14C TaxID=2511130 RepID=UPI00200719E9|nr:hypothetical protein [Paraburkholderia sp. UYCP14C]
MAPIATVAVAVVAGRDELARRGDALACEALRNERPEPQAHGMRRCRSRRSEFRRLFAHAQSERGELRAAVSTDRLLKVVGEHR